MLLCRYAETLGFVDWYRRAADNGYVQFRCLDIGEQHLKLYNALLPRITEPKQEHASAITLFFETLQILVETLRPNGSFASRTGETAKQGHRFVVHRMNSLLEQAKALATLPRRPVRITLLDERALAGGPDLHRYMHGE